MKKCTNSLCKFNDVYDTECYGKCPESPQTACNCYTNKSIKIKQRIKYKVKKIIGLLITILAWFLMCSGAATWVVLIMK